MKVMDRPSMDRFRASSDFELKLVTIRSVGIRRVPSNRPSVVMLSSKIGEVMPKLPSEPALLNTLCVSNTFGYSPLSVAIPQGTVTGVVPFVVVGTLTVKPVVPPWQPNGNVSPIVIVEALPT
jgi:hypothetical protein